jgi:hypothetical protein
MRNYVFGTGAFSAILGGMTLLRSLREETFTWRTALAWISWGISAALAIGAIVDTRRERRGRPVPADSPISNAKVKKREKAMRKAQG